MGVTVADLQIVVDADTSKAEQGLNRVGQSVAGAGKKFGAFTKVIGAGGTAITGFLTKSVMTAANFEQQMSAVVAVGGKAAYSHLGALRKQALQLGKDTSFSASEAAQAMETMLSAGDSLQGVLGGDTRAALNLAAATGSSVPDAASLVVTAMTTMGVSATQAADIITQVTQASGLNMQQFGDSFKYVAGLAGQLGVPMNELSATLGVLANAGIKGEQAGTGLRNMLTSLTAPTSAQSALLKQLGVQVFDANHKFVGLKSVTDQLATVWPTLTDAQKAQYAQTLVGQQGMASFLALMGEGPGAIQKMEDAMNKQGTAADAAKKRMDNFKGAIEQLKGSFETAMIVIGSMFLPALKTTARVLTKLTNVFLGLPGGVQRAIAIVLAFVGVLGTIIAGVGALNLALGLMGFEFSLALAPVLAIIAAVALLGAALTLAYKHNVLGFADGIHTLIGGLKTFGGAFMDAYRMWSLLGPVAGSLKGLAAGIRALNGGNLPGWLSAVADGLDAAGTFAATLWTYFQQVWDGTSTLTAALKLVPAPLRQLVQGFGILIDTARDLKTAFAKGGVMGVLAALPDEVGDVGRAFQMIFGGIGDVLTSLARKFPALAGVLTPLASAFAHVGDAALAFGLMLRALMQGDWSGALTRGKQVLVSLGAAFRDVGKAALSGLKGAGKQLARFGASLADKVGDVAPRLIDWFRTQLGRVDWLGLLTASFTALRGLGARLMAVIGPALSGIDWVGLIGRAGTMLGNALGQMLTLAITGMSKLDALLAKAINAVPWNNLGQIIGKGLVLAIEAGIGLLAAALDFGAHLVVALARKLAGADWGSIARNVFRLLKAAFLGLVGLLAGIGQGIYDELTAQFGSLDWGNVGHAILDGIRGALSALAGLALDLGAWTLHTGIPALTGWITDVAGDVWSGLKALAGWAPGAITGAVSLALNVLSTLGDKIMDGAASAKDWVIGKVPWLAGPLNNAATGLTATFTFLADFLGSIGQKLSGAWSSFRSLIGSAASWLVSLFGIGDDGTGGASVSTSLTAAWSFVASFLGSLGSTLGHAWSSFTALLGAGFSWLVGLFGFGSDGTPSSPATSKHASASWSFVASFLGTIGSVLGHAWSSFTSLLGAGFGWLVGLFGLGDDGTPGTAAKTVKATASWSFVADFVGAIGSTLGHAWSSFTTLLGAGFGWVVRLFDIGGDGTPGTTGASHSATASWSFVANFLGSIGATLGTAWSSFGSLLGAGFSWLGGLFGFDSHGGAAHASVSKALSAAWSIAASITGSVTNALGAAWTSAKALVGSVVGWLKGAIGGTKSVKAAVSIAGSLASAGVKAATGFWGSAKAMIASGASWAGDLVSDGWHGATKTVSATVNFAIKLTGKVTGGIADLLGLGAGDKGSGGQPAATLQTKLDGLKTTITTALNAIQTALTGYDPTADITALNTKLVGGFNAMSGGSLGAAIKAWVLRGAATSMATATDVGTAVALSLNAVTLAGLATLAGGSLGNGITAWIGRGVTTVAQGLTAIGTALAQSLNTAAVTGLGTLSGGALGTAITAWVMRGTIVVAQTLTAVGTALALSLNTAFGTGLATLSGGSLGAHIVAWINRAQTTAAATVNMTVLATGVGTKLQQAIQPALTATVTAFHTLASDVTAAMNDLRGRVRSAASQMAGDLNRSASQMVSQVSGAMSRLVGDVGNATQRMASVAGSAARDMASRLASGARQGASGVRDALGAIPAIVRGVGGDAASIAYNIGANISGSLAAGMYSALGSIEAAAASMIAAASAAMMARAMIHSPSKLTAYFGRMLGQGLVDGMDRMQTAVGRAGGRLMDASLTSPMGTPLLATAGSAPSASPAQARGTVVYQTNHVTVQVDDLDDLRLAVDFVKALPTERELAFA